MSEIDSQMDMDRAEVQDTAIGLPFLTIELPEFEDPAYEPTSIRQPRRYGRSDGDTLPITRFLSDRGQVEILQSEMVDELFREIYWSCYQIRKLAESESQDPSFWSYAIQHTLRCVHRMEAAEEELFIANRPLIVACVKPFYWIGQIWISDFLQEGSRALGNAIRKFDFTRGVPFYAYAQRSIQNRLRNYFRDHIRSGALGIRPSEEMIKIQQVIQLWKDRQGEDPSELILSEMTHLPPERIKKLLPMVRQWQRMPGTPLSLDAALGDTKSSLHDLVADHQHIDSAKEVEQNEVWEAVARLPERLQIILKRRYVEGYTLDEVGAEFSLTRARIKQLQDEALMKIRAFMRETYAKEHNKL
ncbi:sigma-70 family RNA polymerase sigma factor [Kiritimatiellota bacterium B12222]|nr:sigma-70 family RNA polymerase sigma factor [Kiritimatiellota bacterium B12222]